MEENKIYENKQLDEWEEWKRLIHKINELEREAAANPWSTFSYSKLLRVFGYSTDRPNQADHDRLVYRLAMDLLMRYVRRLEEWIKHPWKPIPKPWPGVFFENDFKVDMKQDSASYTLEAELADIKKENVQIDYTDNVLTISARREEPAKRKTEEFIIHERKYGELTRNFYMEHVLKDKIDASFEKGVLKIVLPKKKIAKENIIPIR
jgi:HSP20 family protein